MHVRAKAVCCIPQAGHHPGPDDRQVRDKNIEGESKTTTLAMSKLAECNRRKSGYSVRNEELMKGKKYALVASLIWVLISAFGTPRGMQAQDDRNPYPKMAPLDQYPYGPRG